MTIGLTHDDLTPDEQVNPMDCADAREMVHDWVYLLTALKTDAILPNGTVVISFDELCRLVGSKARKMNDQGLGEAIVKHESVEKSVSIVAEMLCAKRANLAVAYFKSLNDKEFDQ